MTDEEHIEHLIKAPLDVRLTLRQRLVQRWRNWLARWERIWPAVQKITAVIAVISLAIGLVGIVLVVRLAICTNTNLGKRNAPSARDALAHIAFAYLVKDVVTKTMPSDRERLVISAALDVKIARGQLPTAGQVVTGLTNYPAVLASDQDTRNAHPVGKC